jgi:hypothetical protein
MRIKKKKLIKQIMKLYKIKMKNMRIMMQKNPKKRQIIMMIKKKIKVKKLKLKKNMKRYLS